MPKPKTKQASGAARQKAAGRTHVAVWLDPADLAVIDEARKANGSIHRTQFLVMHSLAAAKKILQKN